MAPHAENGVNGSSSETSLDFTTFSNIIDGKLSSTSKTRHGINPASDKPNPEVPVSTPEDVDQAVAAAEKAFKPWANTSYSDRQKAVLAFADGLEKEKDGFARLLTKEQGKPVRIMNFSRVPCLVLARVLMFPYNS
jgi:acyl-CoA reductase-like NAD-dependent aldehyde dehydrogenase